VFKNIINITIWIYKRDITEKKQHKHPNLERIQYCVKKRNNINTKQGGYESIRKNTLSFQAFINNENKNIIIKIS